MEKVLSISVAAYNSEKYLKNCIESLLNSSISNLLDIIIVNDGSTDETLNIARNYEKQYPDIIRVINKKNGGHGSTINASIEYAIGKYYKVLDSDDWVDRDGLEKLMNALISYEVDVVFNPFYMFHVDSSENELIIPYPNRILINRIYQKNHIDTIELYMHAITFKTSIVKQMSEKIDENCFYVDVEYVLFPLENVKNFVCLDFPVYVYQIGNLEQSVDKNNYIKRREQHLRVVKRLVSFYNKKQSKLDETIKIAISNRINHAVLKQYKIFLLMENSTESKCEIIDFDRWLYYKNQMIYKGANTKFIIFIYFNRITGFTFWGLLSWIIRKLRFKIVI